MTSDGCGPEAVTSGHATPDQIPLFLLPLRGHAVLLAGTPRARLLLSLNNAERALARAHAAGHHNAALVLVRSVPVTGELDLWGGEGW